MASLEVKLRMIAAMADGLTITQHNALIEAAKALESDPRLAVAWRDALNAHAETEATVGIELTEDEAGLLRYVASCPEPLELPSRLYGMACHLDRAGLLHIGASGWVLTDTGEAWLRAHA